MCQSFTIGMVAAVILFRLQEGFAQTRYQVTPNIPTLGEISVFLYGTTKMANEIARWNHLDDPGLIQVGQELILEQAPCFEGEQGVAQVRAMWKNYFRKMRQVQQEIGDRGLAAAEIPKPPPSLPNEQKELTEVEPVSVGGSEKIDLGKTVVLSRSIEVSQAPKGREEYEVEKVYEERQVPTLSQTQGMSHDVQGEMLFQTGKYEESLIHFEKALESDPKRLSNWFYKLMILKKLNRFNEIQSTIKSFLKEFPDMAQSPVVENYRKLPGS